jgi:malate synthase
VNVAPAGFTLERDLPKGFAKFFLPLHQRFTPEQRRLVRSRGDRLARALAGDRPQYLPPSEATRSPWQVELPDWCADRRHQVIGPADDAELCVKLLNSGAPSVMLDLEDSMVNTWEHLMLGHRNVVAALHRELSGTVVWTRVRGLHLSQAGIIHHAPASASLFDLALLVFSLELERLSHPLCIYIPKSESAEEALWWKDVFDALLEARGWPRDALKAMALLESHPIAYEMEEFLFNLREYIVGLNLGRRDYTASVIHFNLADPAWLLPDRNTIPLDVPFIERVRALLPEIAHKHGAIAIGGTTAPSTTHPDLRPAPAGAGSRTLEGTRAAVRTVIRYRNGVLEGRGASLFDGCMEDLATDRICRLMIAQRMRYPGEYTPESLAGMFDEELERVLNELGPGDSQDTKKRYRRAREISEDMILSGTFDPT